MFLDRPLTATTAVVIGVGMAGGRTNGVVTGNVTSFTNGLSTILTGDFGVFFNRIAVVFSGDSAGDVDKPGDDGFVTITDVRTVSNVYHPSSVFVGKSPLCISENMM